MKKVKVCFLISSLCNEGPVNVVYNIIRYIDMTQFDVSIITLKPEKENSRLGDFKKLPINIYQITTDKKISILKTFFKLRKLVIQINPDIIHGHCSRPLYLMCLLPTQYKTVYTIHIYPGIQNVVLSGYLKGHAIIRLDNFFTAKCNKSICCSDSISKAYKNKGIIYESIPNGTVTPIWNYNEIEKISLRKKLLLDQNYKYFIVIGRFSKEKNLGILEDVFNELPYHNVKLIMLGDGPLWKALKMNKSDNIIMPGFVSNVTEYLKASDFYISASHIEGLANTLLESMAIGLPMVLSNIPSHNEVLNKFNRKDVVGRIFNNREKSDIVNCIDEILELNAQKARDEIQTVFKKNYTANIMALKYSVVYKELAKMKN